MALLLRASAALLRDQTDAGNELLCDSSSAAESIDATGVRIVALAVRSLLAERSGAHGEAERLAVEAKELADDGREESATSAIVRAACARAFLARGRWEEARVELNDAERLSRYLTEALPWLACETRLALGSAYVTLREREGAASQLVELEAVLAAHPDLGAIGTRVADLRHQVAELPEARNGRAAGLTAAELRLLPLLATHLSFREIGERLYVSRNTIKTQAISIYRKLGVASRSAAIARAAELGLLDRGTL
jgi:LuxR family maltose regulon positive regulatory protein